MNASTTRGRRSRICRTPKALDEKKAALALRMRATGESASTICKRTRRERATVYPGSRREYGVTPLAPPVLKLFRSFPLRSMLGA